MVQRVAIVKIDSNGKLVPLDIDSSGGVSTNDVMSSRRFPDPVSATIPIDTAITATGLDIGAAKYIGLIMPAAWTAAVITFQVSDTLAGNYVDLYDETGIELSLTVAVSKAYTLNISTLKLAPWRFIKVRSGTTGTPVNQVAARTIKLIMKP